MKPYFSHDEGARNDPKLVEVLMTLGHEGKSIYWDLVEMLYEQGGYLMLSQCKSYAFALRTDCDLIKKLVNDFGLFTTDGDKFWSETGLRRLALRNSKSEKAKESAAKRWGNSERNANALPTHSEGNAIKVKEIKEKKPYADSAAPSSAGSVLKADKELDFISFWLAYHGDLPKRSSKADAKKQWLALSAATRALILTGLEAHRAEATRNGPDYLPYATTFLGQQRWKWETFGTISPTNKIVPRIIPPMPDDPCSLWGVPNPDYDHRNYNQIAGQYDGQIN